MSNNNREIDLENLVGRVLDAGQAPLPDNIFALIVAVVHNSESDSEEEWITTDSVISINPRDPMNKYIERYLELQEDWDDMENREENPYNATVRTNAYTGTTFLVGVDYLEIYQRITNTTNGVPPNHWQRYVGSGKKIRSNLTPELISQFIETQLRENIEEIEESFSISEAANDVLVVHPESQDARDYSHALLFQYTDLTEVSQFTVESIELSTNTVFAASATGSKVYEEAPQLELVVQLMQQYRSYLKEPRNTLLILRAASSTSYIAAVYVGDMHAIKLFSTDATYGDFLPEGYLSPYYINIQRELNIYFDKNDGLEFNLFLYALTQENSSMHNFQLNETKVYFLSKDPTVFFKVFNQSYPVSLLPSQTLSEYDTSISRRDEEREAPVQTVVTIPENTYYVSVIIGGSKLDSTVENQFVMDAVVVLLAGSLQRFRRGLQRLLIDRYSRAFDDFTPRYMWTSQSNQRLRMLQMSARHIFVEGYAKRCQRSDQGIIISPQDRHLWEDVRVVEYPREKKPGQPQILYVCPDVENPFPYLMENQDLPNKDTHRYLLCCGATNPRESKRSLFMRYYYPDEADFSPEEEKGNKPIDKTMSSNTKLLDQGKRADLPQFPVSWLLEVGFRVPIQRYGVYKSINSAIHCLFEAMRDEAGDDYLSMKSPAEKEDYVQQWRREVLTGSAVDGGRSTFRKQIYPGVLYQELYDYTDEAIHALVSDVTGRFDTILLYRLLEAYFDVNIFVLGEPAPKEAVRLEIPRNKLLHLRERRLDLPSVVLYKHAKSREDPEPHYELVNIEQRVLLDVSGTAKLYDMWDELYQTYRFDRIRSLQNPYTSYSVRNALIEAGLTMHGQHIDSYGKARGFYVSFQRGSQRIYFSVLSMPQQPLNLPVWLAITPLDERYLRHVINSPPVKRSLSNNVTTGVWFAIGGVENGLYIPIVNVRNENIYIELNYAANPLVPEGTSGKFNHYTRLDQQVNRFLDVITRLYKYYGHDLIADISREVERKQRMVNVEHHLSDIGRYNEVLRLFQLRNRKWLQFLILNTRVIYNIDVDVVAELKNLVYTDSKQPLFLQGLTIASRMGIVEVKNDARGQTQYHILIQSTKLMEDLHYYFNNFLAKQQRKFFDRGYVKIVTSQFAGVAEFEVWVREQLNVAQIVTSPLDLNIYAKHPTYYYDKNGGLFIVQNVALGNRDAALNVALTYLRSRVNLGYSAPRADLQTLVIPAVTYRVVGSTIATFDKRTADSPTILEIQDGKYAALLQA